MTIKKNNLVIFGDSIFKGLIYSTSENRYRLSNLLDFKQYEEKYNISISNYSRVGFSVKKGFEMLKRRFEQDEKVDAVLIEYGGNDCIFRWDEVASSPYSEHLSTTPIEEFEKIYLEMINYLKERNVTTVVTNLPPICPERYLNWVSKTETDRNNILKWLGDVNAIYRYQERYSRKIEEIALSNNIPLINLRDEFLLQRKLEDFYCCDGIHPNENGQMLINSIISKSFASYSK